MHRPRGLLGWFLRLSETKLQRDGCRRCIVALQGVPHDSKSAGIIEQDCLRVRGRGAERNVGEPCPERYCKSAGGETTALCSAGKEGHLLVHGRWAVAA